MPRVQRFACSTSFDHVGIVVLCDDCDDDCCSPELKQVRKEAGIPSYHTLEADSGGVQVYRFTPACLRSYSGTVFVRSLDLSRLTSAQISAARSALRKFTAEMRGRPYSKNLLEMFRAAGYGRKRKNRAEDLTSVFCSELVAAAFKRMGLLDPARSASTYIPADFSTPQALSKRKKKSKRAIKLLHGATLGPEIIVDCEDLSVPKKDESDASVRHSNLIKRKTLEMDPLVSHADASDDVDLRTRVFNPIVNQRKKGQTAFSKNDLRLDDIAYSSSLDDVMFAMDREMEETDYDVPAGKDFEQKYDTSSLQASFVVNAGDSYMQPFTVETDNAPLDLFWDFKLGVDNADGHDIEFVIMGPLPVAADIDEYATEVPVPKLITARMGQGQKVATGSVRVGLPGRYVLKWDNSYSWFASKEIHYACSLKKVSRK